MSNQVLSEILGSRFKGEKGDKGDKGDQGDKGDKGDQGPPGDVPTGKAIAMAIVFG